MKLRAATMHAWCQFVTHDSWRHWFETTSLPKRLDISRCALHSGKCGLLRILQLFLPKDAQQQEVLRTGLRNGAPADHSRCNSCSSLWWPHLEATLETCADRAPLVGRGTLGFVDVVCVCV
eukprot:3529908-Amphidinium_carterae.1